MSKLIWFCYGFFSAIGVILLGIIGFGVHLLMRVISYAPLGLIIIVGFVLVIAMVYFIIRPSKKTN